MIIKRCFIFTLYFVFAQTHINTKMKFIKCIFIQFSFIVLISDCIHAQIQLSFTSQINTICNGDPCNYSGPSILINEVMLTPSSHDGSIYGTGPGQDSTTQGWGEWIELYNPDVCKPVDISCYYLGNNAYDNMTSDYGGGFRIPANTIVPPGGFVVIRGIHADNIPPNLLVQNGGKTIEIIVDNTNGNVCLGGGYRLWFPNAGGWFAFYNNFGVPQDAISWASQTNSCMSCTPCIPSYSGCNNATSLSSYNNIPTDRITYITSDNPSDYEGESWRRIPDGAAWSSSASNPTIGNCNAACNPIPVSSCNGQATVNVTGGTPPYTYLWDDPVATDSSTATKLCEGHYCVTVKDANNNTVVGCIDIINFKPDATFDILPATCINSNPVNLSQYVSPDDGIFSGTGISGTSFNPVNAGEGTHEVTYIYSDLYTCTDTVSQSITVYANPTASLNIINDILCYEDKTGALSVTSLSGFPPYRYLWNNGEISNTISNLAAGEYSVTITDSLGCENSYSITLSEPIALTPSAEVISNASEEMTNDGIASASATGGTSPYSYQWDSGQNTSYINHLAIGTYVVTVTDKNGCNDTTSVNIKIKEFSTLYIPNAFTPDGDGINDVFTPQGTNIEADSFGMYIFNRWGNLVFHTTKWMETSAEPWNGTFNNAGSIEDVIPGTYVYLIEVKKLDERFQQYVGEIIVIK